MNQITKITHAPACAVALAEKINETAQAMTPILNLKAGRGIKITPSASDIAVAVSDGAGRRLLPSGVNTNDILDWSGSGWVIHPAPPTTGKFILGRSATGLTWIPAEKCSAA